MSKETVAGESLVTKKLVSAEHGLDDFDITGLSKVHRVKVGHGIKQGDIFNVYCDGCVKLGATWLGSVEKSLALLPSNTPGYKELIGT